MSGGLLIHNVAGYEGTAQVEVTEEDGGSKSPALRFTFADVRFITPAFAPSVPLDYREVEKLHAALGAWLFDKYVTGEVR